MAVLVLRPPRKRPQSKPKSAMSGPDCYMGGVGYSMVVWGVSGDTIRNSNNSASISTAPITVRRHDEAALSRQLLESAAYASNTYEELKP